MPIFSSPSSGGMPGFRQHRSSTGAAAYSRGPTEESLKRRAEFAAARAEQRKRADERAAGKREARKARRLQVASDRADRIRSEKEARVRAWEQEKKRKMSEANEEIRRRSREAKTAKAPYFRPESTLPSFDYSGVHRLIGLPSKEKKIPPSMLWSEKEDENAPSNIYSQLLTDTDRQAPARQFKIQTPVPKSEAVTPNKAFSYPTSPTGQFESMPSFKFSPEQSSAMSNKFNNPVLLEPNLALADAANQTPEYKAYLRRKALLDSVFDNELGRGIGAMGDALFGLPGALNESLKNTRSRGF